MNVESVEPKDRSALLAIAVRTGLFSTDDAEALLGGVLDGIFAATLPAGHMALACRPGPAAAIAGWTYFAPDQYAEGVWNVWWLGVSPESIGTGVGQKLLRAAEARAHGAGARIIVVETSSRAPQARARAFYAKEGYAECGCVPDFYGDGDHKVIFSRRPRKTEPAVAVASG